jgi:hypothetical protein
MSYFKYDIMVVDSQHRRGKAFMNNLEQIEVVLARVLAVKASGRLAILMALVVVLWISTLWFAYQFFGR